MMESCHKKRQRSNLLKHTSAFPVHVSKNKQPCANPMNLLGLKCICHIRTKLLMITCFTYKMKERKGREE